MFVPQSFRVLAAPALLLGLATLSIGLPVSEALPLPTGPAATLDNHDDGSPLQSEDLPPDGVAAQLNAFIPAAGTFCSPFSSEGKLKPGEVVSLGAAEIAETFLVCLAEFAPNQDVDIRVQAEDGDDAVAETRIRATEEGTGSWSLAIPPGERLGTYVVTASQGPREATGLVAVNPASGARSMVLPDTGRPGTEFRIGLAGFPRRERVRVHLYRFTEDDSVCQPLPSCYTYATALRTVRTNDRGEAIVTLQTEGDDPPNSYLVATDPLVVKSTFSVIP